MSAQNRHARKPLKYGEELFRKLCEASFEGIAIHDKGKILDANQTLVMMLGYELSEFVGMEALDLVAPESRDFVLHSVLSGHEEPYEALCLRKDGSAFVAEICGKAIPYDGRMVRVTAVRDITERKRAEEALSESEERFRHVLDGARDMVYCLNLKTFTYDYVSPSCSEVLGYSPEEFAAVGFMGAGALVHPDDVQRVLENFAQVRTHPNVEYRFRHKELGYRWMSDARSVVFDDKGGAAVVGTLSDITERKRAEAALQNLATFPGENPNPIIRVARNGTVIFANQSSRPLLELWGSAAGASLPPEPYQQVESALTAGKLVTGETVCGERTFLVIWAPIAERDYVNIYGVDITERRRAEEALRESESKARTLLENLPQKIFFKDKDSVYVSCNENYAQDLKIRPHEIVGKTDYEFYAKELAEKYRADDKRIMESGQTEEIEEAYVQDGREVLVHTVKTPVRGEAGQFVGVLGIFWDVTDRRRTEEALQESEERFRFIARATSDVIWDWDLTTGRLWRSEGMRTLFGYAPSEEGPKVTWWYERVHPEDRERSNSGLYATISAGGESWFNEYRFRRADGSYAHVRERSYIIRDGDGKPVRLIGGMTDISKRKRAEEALQESERRYRLLAENARDVIWTVDPNLRTTYISPSVTHLWGYSVEEVVTQTVDQMLTPASLDVAMEALVEELAAESTGQSDPSRSRTLELESVCRDGSTIWTEAKMSALRDERGRLVGILGVSRDISKRKRVHKALEESERRYRLLAENASDIIWIRDLNLRGLYVNPAVTRIRGYTVEEAMAQTPEEILTPASLELAREAVAEELAKEQVEPRDLSWWRILELENICKDGSTVWLEEKVTALRDEDRRIVGILGISRDISDRRRAEEALQETREELESRVEHRMRRGSAYGLTFRELTVLHLVVAGKSDKEIAVTLGISTLTASKHLANILHKMGAASRTEAGVRAVREGLLD